MAMRSFLLVALAAALVAADPAGTYTATITKAEGSWAASGLPTSGQVQIVVTDAAGGTSGTHYSVAIGPVQLRGLRIPGQEEGMVLEGVGGAAVTGGLKLRDDRCVGGALNLPTANGSQFLEFEVR